MLTLDYHTNDKRLGGCTIRTRVRWVWRGKWRAWAGGSVYRTPLVKGLFVIRRITAIFLTIPCPSIIFYFVGVGYQIDSSLFLPITPLLLLLRKRHPAASSCQLPAASLSQQHWSMSLVEFQLREDKWFWRHEERWGGLPLKVRWTSLKCCLVSVEYYSCVCYYNTNIV